MQNENIIFTKYIHKNVKYKATLPVLTNLTAGIYKTFSLPTVFVCPFSAAIIKGVFPEESTAFTWALWLSRSCRHSTWSVKAAAWRGVLQQIKRQYGLFRHAFYFIQRGILTVILQIQKTGQSLPLILWHQYCWSCDCCL